jgi:hypothetical protein
MTRRGIRYWKKCLPTNDNPKTTFYIVTTRGVTLARPHMGHTKLRKKAP